LVGIVGYLFKTLNEGGINLIDNLLDECASPYTENEVIKIAITHTRASVKQVLMILPEEMKKNLCLFLSGGLDSRVLAAILKNYIRNFKTLTFGTERCDEVLIAHMVAKKLGITQIIESYDLNQLADYAYDIVRLSNGFDVVNAAYVIHALKMLRKIIVMFLLVDLRSI
jgi:asparagine synthetase B (glutamine-hydrolysing)